MEKQILTLFLMILGSAISANCVAGVGSSGGGDNCERRIKEITSDIRNWISLGKSKGLQLPIGLSQIQYAEAMQDLLAPEAVTISCPDSLSDPRYKAIFVENAQKTCVRYFETNGRPHIDCDFNRFNSLYGTPGGQVEQYRLIHHEFAGLAGFEKSSGPSSSYEISNQLTSFLREEVVMKLAVKSNSEKNDIAADNTLITKCDVIASTFGGQEILLYQPDPRQSPWRKEDGESGLLLIEGFKILHSGSFGNQFFPVDGLLSGTSTWDSTAGETTIVLRSATFGITGVLQSNSKPKEMRTSKRFDARISIITPSGDLGNASLECVNILN